MAPGTSAEEVRFSAPPVRSVVLTVFFRSLETLQPIHLSRLRELWREEYPSTGSLPPLRPHPGAAHVDTGDEDIPSWPFPYLVFSTADEYQSVSVQNDRFVRSWQFSDAEAYPGYEDLARDLSERLGQFSEVVRAEVARDLVVTASECYYLNELPDVPILDLLVGVSSAWTATVPDGSTLPPTHYAGVRMHIDDPEVPGSHVQVNADADEDGATLSIMSRYVVASGDDDESTDALGGLDVAHAALIRTFMMFTSDEMKSDWGRGT